MTDRSSPVTEQNIEAEAVKLCERLMSLSDIEETAASELEALDTDESNEEAMGLRHRIDLYREAEACITLLLDARASLQPASPTAGWKLVPERPTHRQMDAGLYQSSADASWADVYSMYADMIDAAPSIDDHADDQKPVAAPTAPASDAVAGDAKVRKARLYEDHAELIEILEEEGREGHGACKVAAEVIRALRSDASGGVSGAAEAPKSARKFTGPGHLEQTGYIDPAQSGQQSPSTDGK